MHRKTTAVILVFSMAVQAGAEVLDLPRFLRQVEARNEHIRGALSASGGAMDRSVEGKLIFAPTVFADGYGMGDKRSTVMEEMTGDEVRASGAEVGIAQVARFGTSAKLSYGVNNTEMVNANPLVIPQSKFADTSVQLALEQPLWKNSGGRQYKNTERAKEAQAKSSSYAKLYEAQLLLLDAEAKYWKLSGVRESIVILTQSVATTNDILAFNREKYRKGLTDINDVLQSEAQLKARTFELVTMRSEEREAMQALNEARKYDAETVEESTPLPDTDTVLAMLAAPLTRAPLRNDVKAAAEGVAAQTASIDIAKENTLPDLKVFTAASLNSRNDTMGESMQNTLNTDHPYYTVGLKFSMPLDANLIATVNRGYDRETAGAQQQLNQKKYKQEKEWATLVTRLRDVRDRLAAADELEKAQLRKLEKERERQKQGQSTMFQVFIFEQDHLGSQADLIRTRGAALGLLAQVKLFNDYDGSNGGVQ